MSSSVKTIGVWVVLMVMLVAIYQIFSVPPAEGTDAATASTGSQTSWWSIFAGWLPIVFIFLFFIFFLRAQQKKHADTHEGVRLLNQGRYSQALELFERYRKRQPSQPVGPFNVGSTRLQLWKLESALTELEAAKKLNATKIAQLRALLPEHLALTHALLGRAGDARRELSEIPAGTGDPGRLALVEAILAARSGDAASARTRLSAFEVKQMSGTVGAFARTLDAWCIERLTGELRHVDRVALFGEASPDELRKHWPELVAFVERAPAW